MSTIAVRYDRTLRIVMWLDAFWSIVAGLAWLVLLPAVALLSFGPAARTAAAVVSIVGAVFLGACGAVTFVLLTLRMRRGHYHLPADLRLPLPRTFRAWADDRLSTEDRTWDTGPAGAVAQSVRAEDS